MKLRTNITLVLTLCFIGFAYGQDSTWNEGELFLKNGESKKGLIKVGFHNKALTLGRSDQTVLFKSKKEAKKEKFKQEEVDHFINSINEYYAYIPVSKNKRQLFRRIIEGKASLYTRTFYGGAFKTTNSLNTMTRINSSYDKEYYILKEGESKANLYLADKVLSLRKKALKYFSDCPSLVKKLKAKTYGRKHYQRIVLEYNSCGESSQRTPSPNWGQRYARIYNRISKVGPTIADLEILQKSAAIIWARLFSIVVWIYIGLGQALSYIRDHQFATGRSEE